MIPKSGAIEYLQADCRALANSWHSKEPDPPALDRKYYQGSMRLFRRWWRHRDPSMPRKQGCRRLRESFMRRACLGLVTLPKGLTTVWSFHTTWFSLKAIRDFEVAFVVPLVTLHAPSNAPSIVQSIVHPVVSTASWGTIRVYRILRLSVSLSM